MRKHLELLLISILLIIAFGAIAQDEPADPIHAEKMSWFEFLTGEWTGEANMFERDGSVTRISQHELVELRLDGTLLQVEGTGTDEKGLVVFNALANLFYDRTTGEFRMFAFMATGQFTEASVELMGERHFKWSMDPYPNAHIEYELRVTDEGQWIETGRFSKDGATWVPFIEMKLSKTG